MSNDLIRELNSRIMRHPIKVFVTDNKDDWTTCKRCGRKVRTVFVKTGLCLKCDREVNSKHGDE